MQNRFAATTAALLAAAFSTAQADEETQLVKALKFSREFFAGTHMFAEVSLQSRHEESLPTYFSYERRSDVERIKTEYGQIFARKKGATWVKSDDWAETGTPATPKEIVDLESRLYLVNAAWSPNIPPHDTIQGADVTNLVAHTTDEKGEHFVFERTREDPIKTMYPRYTFTRRKEIGREPLLDQFTGPVLIGKQKLVLTVDYSVAEETKKAQIRRQKSKVHND